MNEEQKRALRDIIDYLYVDEAKDFEALDRQDSQLLENHIFNDILIIENWLNENQ